MAVNPNATERMKLRALLGPLDVLQRYTITEACAYLRQSRITTYKQINDGRLPVIRDRGRVYVPGSAIAARSSLPEATAA